MKYDAFISYRREGGYDTAKHLNDLLVRDGYRVSFDIDTLRNGDFDTQLLERIEQCKDFILIIDEHAFDRTLDPTFDPKKDWLRCELAHALKHNKNIIPIFLSGVSGFPDGLPVDIVEVVKKNGPKYNKFYFNDFYVKLKKEFLLAKRNRGWWIFGFSLMFILLLVGGYFIYSDYQKYNERIKSLINSTINDDTEAGIAILCEALPSYLREKYKFSILRDTDKIVYTTIDAGYKLFNDECVAINADASTIATSEYGNSISLLDIATAQITTIESEYLPYAGERAIAFNPTRKNLVISCYYYPHLKIIVYDLENHKEVYYQELGNIMMGGVKYKNDYIVLYGYDGIILIDTNRGIIDDNILKKGKTVRNVEFNTAGDKIYIVLDGQIILYDINEKCTTSRIAIDVGYGSVMSFADDSIYMYIGYNKHISKHYSSTLEQVKELEIPDKICSIKFFKDDTIIYGDNMGGLHKLDFLSETDFQYELIHKDAITRIAINNQEQIYSYSKGVIGVNNDYYSGIWMDCLHKDDLCSSYVDYEDSISLVSNNYGDVVMCKLGSTNRRTIKLRDICKSNDTYEYSDLKYIQYTDSVYLFVTQKNMILYDLKNDKVLDCVDEEYFNDVIFKDSLVYATSYEPNILKWKIDDNLRFTSKYITPDPTLEDDIECISVMNASGDILYSVGNRLFLYDAMRNNTLLYIAAEDITGIIPFGNNKNILIHNSDNDIEIFQFGVDKTIYIPTDIYEIKRFAVSPKFDLLFGGDGCEIHVWNTKSGELIKTYITDYAIEQLYFNAQTNQLIILTHNQGLLSWNVLLNEDEIKGLMDNHRKLTKEEQETVRVNYFYSLF